LDTINTVTHFLGNYGRYRRIGKYALEKNYLIHKLSVSSSGGLAEVFSCIFGIAQQSAYKGRKNT
jgi:hypothetical protein